MKTEEQETRSEEGERPPSAADLAPREQAPRRRWTAFLTGNAARARREERARRRVRSRQRRYQKSVARRRQRELASLERRLLGRSPTRGSRSMPFSRPAADDTESLETMITQIVERALEDDRERSKAEVEDAVDMRVRLLAKR